MTILLKKVNTEYVKVKYSLYTFKQTFLKDKYYNKLYELTYCRTEEDTQRTQADIDRNLDKIYEFRDKDNDRDFFIETPAETERRFYWDGKTDPKVTGKTEPEHVRACLHIAAHNADTGELIGIGSTLNAVQTYGTAPVVKYTVNKDQEGKETLSAKIYVAMDRPVKFTAFLATSVCGLGFATYDMVNKGAEAIIASINSSGITPETGFHDIPAYTELTDPKDHPQNSLVKVFEWSDIRKINWQDPKWKEILKNATKYEGGWPWVKFDYLNGDYFAPTQSEYNLGIIVEALDGSGNPILTYTGINEGFVGVSSPLTVPQLKNPKTITSLPKINTDDINVTMNACWCEFIIHCPAGVYAQSYVVYDLSGKMLIAGRFSGAGGKEAISASEFHSGIYFVQVTVKENGVERVVTKKVVKQ